MEGLGPGSMHKGCVNLVPNLIFDIAVAFLYIGDTQLHLILLSVVDYVIVCSEA